MYTSARELRPFLLDYVTNVLGLTVRNNMTSCPLCGSGTGKHKSGAFSIFAHNELWRCHSCGAHGDLVDLVKALEGLEQVEAIKKIADIFSVPNYKECHPNPIQPKPQPAQSVRSQIASVDKRNAFYANLLGMLTLLPNHAANLRKRGVPEPQLWQYRSVPDDVYSNTTKAYLRDLTTKLISVVGCVPSGVPGFYTDETGQWTVAFPGQGFLIPARDIYGRIQGVQCRRDGGQQKYRWISSNPDPARAHPFANGTSAETVIHCRFGTGAPDTLYITEGPLKGDIASYVLNRTFIAVPGVNSLGSLPNVLRTFQKRGFTRVVCALDMDRDTNINVAKAVDKVQNIVLTSGLGWYDWKWNARYKGVDDWAVATHT